MTIAVFLPNWIGDAVMATPALRALRRHFARARIIGICKPYVAGVLDGAPWLDALVYLDSKGPWGVRWPAVAWKLTARFARAARLAHHRTRTHRLRARGRR